MDNHLQYPQSRDGLSSTTAKINLQKTITYLGQLGTWTSTYLETSPGVFSDKVKCTYYDRNGKVYATATSNNPSRAWLLSANKALSKMLKELPEYQERG